MVLNALAIDPRRTWKGAWRWFHEQVSCWQGWRSVPQVLVLKGRTLHAKCLFGTGHLCISIEGTPFSVWLLFEAPLGHAIEP